MSANDIEVWQRHPEFRWMFDRLKLATAFGHHAEPHGIWPDRWPIVSKPIMNLYGMGIGCEVIWEERDFRFRPGCFWSQKFDGPWRSYDVDLRTSECYLATAYGSEWCSPTRWRIAPAPLAVVSDMISRLQELGPVPDRLNLEFVGWNIVEAHPRWTAEFAEHYGNGPFVCDVAWSESLEVSPPEGYVDTRLCDTNYLRLAEGKPARIGIRISPE